MSESRSPKKAADTSAEIEQKANAVLQAIFFHFTKHKLTMDGSNLVLAAAYAMVLNQAVDDKEQADLADLFEKMVANTKKGKIILPGGN